MHVIPGGGYNRTLLCVKQTDTKPDDFMMFDHVTMAPESVSVHNVSLQGQGMGLYKELIMIQYIVQ